MFPFTEIGPFDRTEKKALLFAALFCALFIGLLSVFSPAKTVRQKELTLLSTTPLTTPVDPSKRSHVDPLDRFRFVPENFSKVDFKNFTYGVYSVSVGKPVSLTLNDGKMWDDSGWFNLEDVYYQDVTGDGSPEAIVRLLHLRCNGSCDGGADLFYIYSKRNGRLKNIWQYETGSFAYGCDLKSFTLEGKQVVLELSNGCVNRVMSYPGPRI
ncbi:MAG TPA: hypothetical protein VJ784_00685 [Pyrinomonadaceae bacterium]|jgi:hypothetical protein|nr:hypothetical protein [Pyrinomonadaceae bacterium]